MDKQHSPTMNTMKKIFTLLGIIISSLTANATIHEVQVWDGYFQFLSKDITIQLGDTVQWLPLDTPMMTHTITSTNIPEGAEEFDQVWNSPDNLFFQYVPQVAGLYEYECTPHAHIGMILEMSLTSYSFKRVYLSLPYI